MSYLNQNPLAQRIHNSEGHRESSPARSQNRRVLRGRDADSNRQGAPSVKKETDEDPIFDLRLSDFLSHTPWIPSQKYDFRPNDPVKLYKSSNRSSYSPTDSKVVHIRSLCLKFYLR